MIWHHVRAASTSADYEPRREEYGITPPLNLALGAIAFVKERHMKRKWLVILLCGLATGLVLGQNRPCRPDKHAKLPVITGLTYHKARKKMLADGWQPVQIKSFNEADSDPDINRGNGRIFWKKGYVEVEACSGTGVAACSFLFKDVFGNRVRVSTAGEELPRQRAFARVTGFDFVCE
jgi:hypothetical protein